MGWEALIPLIINNGLPLAEKLWQKWTSGKAPTQADWDELKIIASQTFKAQVILALTRNNVALDSPKAVEVLAAVA